MTTPSYWCYRCARFIRVSADDAVVCPHCNGGFVEAVGSTSPPPPPDSRSDPMIRRRRRNHGADSGSPFNPVIVLRGAAEDSDRGGGFELYYDDGSGSGLQPLPRTISEFLMGSGFDQLLDQLSQIGRPEQPAAASKAAVESIPTIEISETHVETESQSHCAVCKEAFILGAEAREMPCKHIYHPDCILPWLSLRNSCPVCRHELPTDSNNSEGEAVGLTIWRLPGGGFAVGRFSGGRDRQLPVVYTEMDGGFNNSGIPRRRIVWESRRNRGGIGRVFRNMFSFFGRLGSTRAASSDSNMSRSRSSSSSSELRRRSSWRRGRSWVLDEESGRSIW